MFIFFQVIFIIIIITFSIIMLVLLFNGKLINIIFNKEKYIEEQKEQPEEPDEITEFENRYELRYGADTIYVFQKTKNKE